MKFAVYFDDVATSGTINTFKTMLAILAADTVGYRARLLKLSVGPSDDAPADLNVALQLKRVDDVSAGGGVGTANSNPTPVAIDSLSRAAVITAGEDYLGGGVEPTAYGSPLWQIDFNRRNSIIMEWLPEEAPIISRDQVLGLLAAPRTGAAVNLSGYFLFEEF